MGDIMITSLYLHIPFCKKICTYCDFAKLVGNEALMEQYIASMIEELNHYLPLLQNLRTIHLGGGTPTALPIHLLEKLLNVISHHLNFSQIIEFGIEVNPNDVTLELTQLFKKHHINRISLGAESSHKKHLLAMNRSHNVHQISHAVRLLKAAGINNINLDFIYAWPNQTMKELESDIDYAISLKPTHLSFYALILEERTKLYHDYKNGTIALIDVDIDAMMYERIMELLPNKGFMQYEISNFAIPGYESKHNLSYWNTEEYLGIGMGAHSQIDSTRFHNFSSIKKYIKTVLDTGVGVESQDSCDLFQETFLMGLRKTQGVNLDDVFQRFSFDVFDRYPKIRKNIQEGLLKVENNHLLLTKRGMMLMNYVELSFI